MLLTHFTVLLTFFIGLTGHFKICFYDVDVENVIFNLTEDLGMLLRND